MTQCSDKESMEIRKPAHSKMGYPSSVLLLCVGLFGFFSGSLVTMYSGLTKCHENVERLDPVTQCAHVVEPIVQKRLMGKLKHAVDAMMHDGAWLFG